MSIKVLDDKGTELFSTDDPSLAMDFVIMTLGRTPTNPLHYKKDYTWRLKPSGGDSIPKNNEQHYQEPV